jgi:hypothetical protein
MSRTEAFDRALANLAHVGSANEVAPGPALAKLIRAAIDEENAHAAKTGKPALEPRKVAIGIMAGMRNACTRFRDELDGIDSVGKYK